MKSLPHALIIFLFLALAMRAHAEEESEKEYVGCFTCCFESNFFNPMPNPHSEFWYVTSMPKNFSVLAEKIPPHGSDFEYFLKVKAKLGPKGRFGHMGIGTHKMEITQILELREYHESDGVCGIPPPEMITAPTQSSANNYKQRDGQTLRVRPPLL